jgi:protein gp37
MGETTAIEWTDRTWNPWQGCHKVSPKCTHCYMYREKKMYGQKPDVVVRSKPPTFNAPLSKKWSTPAHVFVCSWSDFWIEEADPWRDEAWAIIRRTPWLTYQIPTARPERILRCLPPDWGSGYPNVWLGVSVENQDAAERRVPALLRVPAVLRFLSCEPLLGRVDLRSLPIGDARRLDALTGHTFRVDLDGSRLPTRELAPRVDWVIGGGETGGSAVRPTHPDWARHLRNQCERSGVPFFWKQWGEWAPTERHTAIRPRGDAGKVVEWEGRISKKTYTVAIPADADDNAGPVELLERVGRADAGAELDGRTWKQMPERPAAPRGEEGSR